MSIHSILKNFLRHLVTRSPKGYHTMLRRPQLKFIAKYLDKLYPQLC